MPFILYRSSAGSGKTYTLVKEYLKLVLKKPDEFRHILALTFTNKAAQEMKDRVMQYLASLSNGRSGDPVGQPGGLLDQLQQETGLEEEILVKRSGQTLKLILHHYSDFSVATIDSFMHRVIRTFAHDLHLPLDFKVEMDNDFLLSQSIDNLLQRVGKDEALTKALVEFILYKSDNDKGWNVEKELGEIGQQLFQEKGQLAMEVLKRQLLDIQGYGLVFKKIRTLIGNFEQRISRLAGKAVEVMERHAVQPDWFFHGNTGIGAYFYRLAENKLEKIIPNSYVTKTIETDTWYSKTVAPEVKRKIDEIKTELAAIYLNINEIIVSEYPDYQTLLILEKNILPLAVIHEIEKELEIIKKENNILPIGEFNKMIAGSVLNEPVPFIYERLGEWYHHYMIDEFQDTSVLQWQNLLPLVENSLSYDYTSIVVGDGKQAIYRWRNGEVEQFSRLPEVYLPFNQDIPEGRKLVLRRHYQEHALEKNYRTCSEIVRFNNELYRLLSQQFAGEQLKIYKGVEQIPLDNKTGGYVSLEFQLDVEKDLTLNDAQLDRIGQIIQECRDDGYRWKDIAVLCRSNLEGSLVSRFLIGQGVNVSSSESVLLRNSPLVNVLISAMRILINPYDQVNREVVTRFIHSSSLQEEMLSEMHSGDFLAMPVFELSEKLVRDFAFCDQPDAFIIFFLDTVLQYSQKFDTSVSGFLNWWSENEMKVSVITPTAYDAVRVLTIHKAKGLEFDVVIYPFAKEKLRAGQSGIWANLNQPGLPELKIAWVPVNKNMEMSSLGELYAEEMSKSQLDFLNVLYVATTRPRDRLYILTGKPSKTFMEGKSVSDLLSIYLTSKGIDPFTTKKFILGSPSPAGKNGDTINPEFVFNRFHSVPWTSRVAVRLNHPADWDVEQPEAPRATGILIHDFLARVTDAEGLSALRENFLQQNDVPESQVVALENCLKNIMKLQEAPLLFNSEAEIRNETEIVTPEGRVYRPDRLVLYPDRTIILDYKTGAPRESHDRQILQYADILREMGYPGVEGWLLYLEPKQMIRKVS